jgi:hypothetical protein
MPISSVKTWMNRRWLRPMCRTIWYAEKRKRAARLKVYTHDRHLLRCIDHKEPAVGPRDERPGKAVAALGLRGVVNSQLVVAKIYHQLNRPARQNAFLEMRLRVTVVEPEVVDEVEQRRDWSIKKMEHRDEGPR